MAEHRDTTSPATIQLGGRTYLLARPRVGMARKYTDWLRARLAELPRRYEDRFSAVKAQVQDLAPDLQRHYLDQAAEEDRQAREADRAARDPDSPEARTIRDGFESTAFWLWLLLRPEHPEMSLEKVSDLLEDMDLPAVQETVSRALRGGKRDPEPEGDPRGNAEARPGGAATRSAGSMS